MRKNKGQITASFITCILLMAFMAVLVYAANLAEYRPTIRYEMGRVDIGLFADRQAQLPLEQLADLKNLAPASSSEGAASTSFVVRNLDEQPVYCRVFFAADALEEEEQTHPLWEVLQVAIWDEAADESLYTGSLPGLQKDAFSRPIYLGAKDSAESQRELSLRVWLDSSAGNDYNITDGGFLVDQYELIVEAVQAKNNPDQQFDNQ